MTRAEEPGDGDERSLLLGWLAFHRDALEAKCAGLAPEQLVTTSTPPSVLSLLGLVRHLTEMEHAYFVYGLGGGTFEWVYCSDEHPEADIEGIGPHQVDESMANWETQKQAADDLIVTYDALDRPGAGNRRSLRWNLLKVIGEYSRHNGHADLLREAIDGSVGE